MTGTDQTGTDQTGTNQVVPAAQLGRVHFIGLGGVGMSGLARLLLARGAAVSGSDAKDSAVLAELRSLGATAHVGHAAANLAGADTVVVSSAIRQANPELAAARAAGLRILHRSQALASLMAGRRAVAVAGTHGKTTTTAMLTVALQHCGADPSFAIGGELMIGGASAREGSGDVFVAEADESDASFLRYSPTVAIVTNVEADHLDHYGTAEAVHAAFDAFTDRIVPGGALVTCADDPGAVGVARRLRGRRRGEVAVLTYGEAAGSDVRLTDLQPGTADSAGMSLRLNGFELRPQLSLRVLGRHNAANAAAAWAAGVWLGLDGGCLAEGLGTFGGTRRRFEVRGEAGGVRVIDDYAHHPTEVAAVLQAARGATSGRVIAVFQPHLYSRTRLFAAEFGRALAAADHVLLLDVYAAREDPEPGVSSELVARAVSLPAERVSVPGTLEAAVVAVAEVARPGDLVLTIGAGDVTALGPVLLRALAERVG